MTTQLLLVRHAESEWNRLCRYAGQRDVWLSDRGKMQARRLADRLEHEQLTAIYASPLRRARETADAVAARHRLEVKLDARLTEIHHGLWQGLTSDEVRTQYPSEYADWQTQPHRVVMPQGESLADVAQRAGDFITDELATHPSGKILLCSHDAVLRVILLRSLGLGLEHFWKWDFCNASLTILQADDGNHARAFRIEQLNETMHLQGVESEPLLQAL